MIGHRGEIGPKSHLYRSENLPSRLQPFDNDPISSFLNLELYAAYFSFLAWSVTLHNHGDQYCQGCPFSPWLNPQAYSLSSFHLNSPNSLHSWSIPPPWNTFFSWTFWGSTSSPFSCYLPGCSFPLSSAGSSCSQHPNIWELNQAYDHFSTPVVILFPHLKKCTSFLPFSCPIQKYHWLLFPLTLHFLSVRKFCQLCLKYIQNVNLLTTSTTSLLAKSAWLLPGSYQ